MPLVKYLVQPPEVEAVVISADSGRAGASTAGFNPSGSKVYYLENRHNDQKHAAAGDVAVKSGVFNHVCT
jgi:hypothetical protein